MTQVKVSSKTRNDYDDNGILRCWEWCVSLMGTPGSIRAGGRWEWDLNRTFMFRDEWDAFLFRLAWT